MGEFSFEWKTIQLTVLQSCMIADVALVHLVLGCHRGEFNVSNIQDCSQHTIHTSKLLKYIIGIVASNLASSNVRTMAGTDGGKALGSSTRRSLCILWCQTKTQAGKDSCSLSLITILTLEISTKLFPYEPLKYFINVNINRHRKEEHYSEEVEIFIRL